MSVDLHVGLLDEGAWGAYLEGFRRTFAALRQALREAGAPEYQEPAVTGRSWALQVWPSNGLAYLQRFAAYFPDPDGPEGWPAPGDRAAMPDPLQDEVLQDAYYLDQQGPFQHLIFHDAEHGFWVPVDFPGVIMPAEGTGLGPFVGSSVRLAAECERLAGLLGLPLNYDPDDRQLWHAADHPGAGPLRWQRYGIESFNLLRLHHACRKSLELRAAIYLD
jgi:hypothetical protein